MIVCKFGGSSVADHTQIRKVRNILLSDSRRTVVVVSAPGKRDSSDIKITDMLYSCTEAVENGNTCNKVFKNVIKRYLDIAKELNIDSSELEKALNEVQDNINNGLGADYAASRGEYLSGVVFASYLGWTLIDPKDYIVIDEDGRVDEVTYANLKAVLKEDGKYIIPGFYGADKNSNIKTFSRGGSDITGSILASAVNAEVYENWTDVSGLLAADPRIITNAKGVEELTYMQVRELSELGASVFHEEAIAPVEKQGIPINIKNTNKSEDKGTFIVKESDVKELIGVSAKEGFSTLRLRKLMITKPVIDQVNSTLAKYGVKALYSSSAIDSLIYIYQSKQLKDKDALLSELEALVTEVKIEDDQALIGYAGEDTTAYVKAVVALSENNIDVYFSSYGASSVSTAFLIKAEDAKPALKVLYDALF